MERHHFQQELGALKERLLAMGGLAEDRVRTAMQGLVDRDSRLIDDVLNGDMPLNALHIEIDDLCLKLLALHSPMAADLRAVMAAIKINSDLERVGDMAVNIAEAARRYAIAPAGEETDRHPAHGHYRAESCCETRSTRTCAATCSSRSASSTKTTCWMR